MKNRFLFFILISIIGMIGGLGEWFMYRSGIPFLKDSWTLLIFFLLPLAFILPNILEDCLPRPLTKLFALIGGYWLIFFYYSFLLMLLDFLVSAGSMIFQIPSFGEWFTENGIPAGFFLILLLIVFGRWNAFHIVTREVRITTDKPLPRDITIAFVSDIHLGTLLGKRFSRRLTKKILALQPDLILLGGDIIDGNLEFVIQDESYKNLLDLTAPLGVFAVYGNHDYFGMDIRKEQDLFAPAGIRFLKNQSVTLTDGIQLTGMDDYRNDPYSTPKPPDDSFHILVDHQPWRLRQTANTGYDLYLAGHTHAGQFYPNRLITKKVYALDYGTRKFNQMTAIVSSGCGFWGTPVRIGPPPEVVFIRLRNIK